MEQTNNFIGIGWSFPPSFDKQNRSVVMTEDYADINKSLVVILTTRLGERIMLPDFGSPLQDAIFESMNTSMLTYTQNVITTAIRYYEPRIDVEEVVLTPVYNEGYFNIHIHYKVRGANSRFNFVYPYYLQEANNLI